MQRRPIVLCKKKRFFLNLEVPNFHSTVLNHSVPSNSWYAANNTSFQEYETATNSQSYTSMKQTQQVSASVFLCVFGIISACVCMHPKLTCVTKWTMKGKLSKTITKMMTVVRMAISSTRATRSDKAHFTFSFFELSFGRRTPFENPFSAAASNLDPLMTGAALVTDIAAKSFRLFEVNLEALAESFMDMPRRSSTSKGKRLNYSSRYFPEVLLGCFNLRNV